MRDFVYGTEGLTPKTPENTRKLRALSDRRQQVVEDRVREMARLEACADAEIAAFIRESIESLETVERTLDEQIERLIQTDVEFQEKAQILSAQKGVGQKTVNILLSHFPELGTLTRGQVAGLAPHARESGTWCGRRRIYGGRAAARHAMYMAAKTAARWCPVISEFYQRLRERGKPYNVAIIACARKMLVHLNTQLKPKNRKSPPITTIAT
ncbi:MAG: transposase [Planctomycetaceae bacterium]